MLNVYATDHVNSRTVCAAFARGCGAPIVPPAPLLPGDVAMYGCLRGLLPTLRQARAEGRNWAYLDRPYLCREKGFYRCTWNALQHDGRGTADPARWRALGLALAPWRHDGRHVLVCPPTEPWATMLGGIDAGAWLAFTLDVLGNATDREIRIRPKPRKGVPGKPLAIDLAGCWAVVTHASNAAVEALIAGVPIFATGPCAAASMGKADLAQIEAPALPDDRARWAAVLAANQWTSQEMSEGTCWRALQRE